MLKPDSHTSSLSDHSGNVLSGTGGRPLSRRERNIAGPLCSRGLSPVGTFLGEDSDFRRRMGLSHDCRNGNVTLGRRVEEAWLRNRLTRSEIRACSARFFLALSRNPDQGYFKRFLSKFFGRGERWPRLVCDLDRE